MSADEAAFLGALRDEVSRWQDVEVAWMQDVIRQAGTLRAAVQRIARDGLAAHAQRVDYRAPERTEHGDADG
ncbi:MULTISPECIES: hypothetical protein [Streptomyces]|uniref:Uncharacterized protein n=1 Tax=Streptomyces fradiae ATCC 10745 = DSM 40063 TaxID=1319510 RepID=A0A1Y2NTX8_STRFR|nr:MULTISPECIES: hypothetical protein [Streptomyces]KAF0651725.1 hypothetical protein K701_01965 [Streptomyces fradiae ATCC 10745 = DSM 40063]OSY50780.1 hypothetical protein BG846_03578 [Streptomyces fradiae ATCC 10745 = DSM 40063]QEV11152.1 hypothetical protein CP974_03035 [Streptomyces fradiae ATCC 10745 = DSM 40063]